MRRVLHVCSGLLVAGVLISTLFVSGDLRAAPGHPQGPLTNTVVNAADTTAHDTQNSTSIVLGSGSNVITSFLNTAVNNGSNNHDAGWSRSTNGGVTWTDGGALPSATGGDFGQTVLARDTTSGKVYMAAQTFTGTSAVQMFESTDDAATWASPVNAMPGFTGGDYLVHPWVTVDNFPGTGQGYVYVVAKNNAGGGSGSKPAGVYVARSTDGGATFGTPVGPLGTNGAAGPTIVIGKDHTVHVFWWINLSPAVIRYTKSTNLGVTFSPLGVAATLAGTGANGDLGLGGGFSTNSFPAAAVNPVTGDLFVVYNDRNGTDKGDIFFMLSGDGGATWDGPNTVNSDSIDGFTHDQWMPAIAFTPDGKHGMISWYDRRGDPSNSLIERWGATLNISEQAGAFDIGPNFRVSTGNWPVVVGQDSYIGAAFVGFYDGIAADNNFFYIAWADNRLSDAAHTNQPDVRVAKIPVNSPPPYDLDRDLQTDRTIYRPSSGYWFSALSGGGATATNWGLPSDVDVMADFDADGIPDIAVWRPSNGTWYVIPSSFGIPQAFTWGMSGDVPLAGDVDGDGFADPVIYRPSTGTWYASLSTGGTGWRNWGAPGDQPMLADFNGDGRPDLVVYRPSTGQWFVLEVLATGDTYQVITWGVPGDIPVVGDYDGDGIADAAIFRPSTGQWIVKKSSGGVLVVNWGASGDIPVSGDWDGDGKSDFTVWRPSNGWWFTQYAVGGISAVPWGATGDKPIGRLPGS